MVKITEYFWGGKWGPFKIKTHCADCDIYWGILEAMMQKEFKGKDVQIEKKPWLDHWFYCILRGTFHAPIIIVDGKKFFQYGEKKKLFKREELVKFVEKRLS